MLSATFSALRPQADCAPVCDSLHKEAEAQHGSSYGSRLDEQIKTQAAALMIICS
jgi:hypothetical protein